MERRDLYIVLGVERDATEEQIKSAYRRLAREHHPDVNPGDEGAEERFKEISVAKEVLLSKEKRALYDEFGFDGLASGFDASEARAYRDWSRRASRSPGFEGYSSGGDFGGGPGGASGIDVEDLLSQLFGSSRGEGPSFEGFQGRGGPSRRRGGDLEARLEVDFVDAVVGNEVSLEIQGRSPLRVTLPRGVKDGARIRLAGQGQPAPAGGEGKPGDLYLQIVVRPHPVFRREGNDLHVDVPVTVPELILGAAIKVPTPDGRVDVRIPPRSANGQTLRLREKGIAVGKSDAKRGHLFLHLVAVLPSDADPAVEEIAKKLEPFYGDADPRAALRWEAGQ